MVDLFFADDACQKNPSRPGMGPLIGIGGIHVPADYIRTLEVELSVLCSDYGFPHGEEFKWSPRKDMWMYGNLVGPDREHFYTDVVALLRTNMAKAVVVIEDTTFRPALHDSKRHEVDVTRMFLERVQLRFVASGTSGIVIVDRPSGDRAAEERFLMECLEFVQGGTTYVKPDRIALNVVSTPSKLLRLLQCADLVTSSTVAAVAGEKTYSPPVLEAINQVFHAHGGRIGGVGLKIHPSYKYVNLYHWLVGDKYYWRANAGVPLPLRGFPYYAGPNSP